MKTMFLIPIIGGTIGYFTNWLAIKMIFRPYEEKFIFGIKVPFTPGLIAVERQRITEQIGYVVTNHLLTNDDIKNKISAIDFTEITKKIITSIENDLVSKDETFESLLKNVFGDNYDQKLKELSDLFTDYISKNTSKTLSQEELVTVENNLRAVLPDILTIIKTIFEKNLYSIDSTLISILDDVIKNFTKGFGALFAGFINSESIYVQIQEKVIYSIENDSEEIINRIIDITYENNSKDKEVFYIDNISLITINSLLQTKISDMSHIFNILKSEEIITRISNNIKEHLLDEADTLIVNLDIKSLIINKMNEMPLSEIEELIVSISKREIKAITNIGGVLGFVIGLITILFY